MYSKSKLKSGVVVLEPEVGAVARPALLALAGLQVDHAVLLLDPVPLGHEVGELEIGEALGVGGGGRLRLLGEGERDENKTEEEGERGRFHDS